MRPHRGEQKRHTARRTLRRAYDTAFRSASTSASLLKIDGDTRMRCCSTLTFTLAADRRRVTASGSLTTNDAMDDVVSLGVSGVYPSRGSSACTPRTSARVRTWMLARP